MLLLKRLNWRVLILHVLAIPCLVIGLQQLEAVRWVPFAQAYQRNGVEGMRRLVPTGTSAAELISAMRIGPLYMWAGAVLIGGLFSAVIVWRRRESWLMPLLVLVVTILLSRTGYAQSSFVLKGLAWLRWPFERWPTEVRLGIVGTTLLVLGIGLFGLTWRKNSYPLEQLHESQP